VTALLVALGAIVGAPLHYMTDRKPCGTSRAVWSPGSVQP
jgi:hypothetical protein